MAKFDARVTLDTGKLDRIIKNLDVNAHDAVRAVAFAVEAKAKVRAPVDTGALRSSIYTRVGNKVDGYGVASAEARQRRQEAEIVELPAPPNNTTAHVGPCVGYGLEVELGSSRKAGRPYLGPAVREVEDQLEDAMRKVVTDG